MVCRGLIDPFSRSLKSRNAKAPDVALWAKAGQDNSGTLTVFKRSTEALPLPHCAGAFSSADEPMTTVQSHRDA